MKEEFQTPEMDQYEGLYGDETAKKLVEYNAKEWGWEPVRARSQGGSVFCDRDVKPFFEAANNLLTLLKEGKLFADTDANIEDLTRMRAYPWWKYVDPAFSRQRSGPHAGSVVVLWHCGDHIVSLHNRGGGNWEVFQGEDEMLDLQKLIDEMDNEDEILDLDETVENQKVSLESLLTEEDIELRKYRGKRMHNQIDTDDEDE